MKYLLDFGISFTSALSALQKIMAVSKVTHAGIDLYLLHSQHFLQVGHRKPLQLLLLFLIKWYPCNAGIAVEICVWLILTF